MSRRNWVLAVLLAAMACTTGAEAALLGPGDRLRITFYRAPELTGELSVGADGRIAIPLLGTFDAAGATPSQLGEQLGRAFVQDERPSTHVVVEVVAWRPVYVGGDVSKPGAYAYLPGLTVLRALALAGGSYRLGDVGLDALNTAADNRVRQADALAQLSSAAVLLAGLVAERDGTQPALLPELAALLEPAEAERRLAAESEALSLRQATLAAAAAAKRREAALAVEEIAAYTAQLEGVRSQVRFKQLQLKDAEALTERGLGRRPDVLNLQALIAALASSESEVNAGIARAQREAARAEAEAAQLEGGRRVAVLAAIEATQREIGRLLAAERGAAGLLASIGAEAAARARSVTIMRRGADGTESAIAATDTTALQPGDAVTFAPAAAAPRAHLAEHDAP